MWWWLSACVGVAEPVTVRVWIRWPGASVAEVEERLTIPMEAGLAGLPSAEPLIGESWPGMSRVTVRLPEASAVGLAEILTRTALPSQVDPPWADAIRGEPTEWLLPIGASRGLGASLEGWPDTPTVPVVEVVLPEGSSGLVEELRRASASSGWASADALLDLPLSTGGTARGLAAVRRPEPRTRARWDGAPVELWHLLEAASVAGAIPVPSGEALAIALWEEVDPGPIEDRLRASGAAHVLTVSGRPFPGGDPEPGRLEIRAWWDGPIPEPSGLPEGSAIRRISAEVSVVRGPEDRLRSLGPPPRTTWDLAIDPERAEAVGPEQAASAIRDALVGARLWARDGTAIEVRAGEARTLEALSELAVGERDGQPIRVRDLATVEEVPTERYRLRYGGAPAAAVDGPAPEGTEEVARLPRWRLGG